MARAADIVVNLVAKTGRFQRSMNRSARSTQQFARTITRSIAVVGRMAGALGALGGAAGGAGLLVLTKQAIDANDELGKMAQRLGIAADKLKELQIAGELSGQNIRQLNIGLQRMTRRIAEVAGGTGEAQQAIKDLGLNAQELVKLTPDEQFRRVAEAMLEVDSASAQVLRSFKLFDSEGVGLKNVFRTLASEGFQQVIRDAREMNAILGEFDTAQYEEAQNQLLRLRLSMEGIRNSVTIDLLPVFKQLADETTRWSKTVAGQGLSVTQRFIGGWLVGLAALKFAWQELTVQQERANAIMADAAADVVETIARSLRLLDKIPLFDLSEPIAALEASSARMRIIEAQNRKVVDATKTWKEILQETLDGYFDAQQAIRDSADETILLNRQQRNLTGALEAQLNLEKQLATEAAKINSIVDGTRTAFEKTTIKIAQLREALTAATDPARSDAFREAIAAQAAVVDRVKARIAALREELSGATDPQRVAELSTAIEQLTGFVDRSGVRMAALREQLAAATDPQRVIELQTAIARLERGAVAAIIGETRTEAEQAAEKVRLLSEAMKTITDPEALAKAKAALEELKVTASQTGGTAVGKIIVGTRSKEEDILARIRVLNEALLAGDSRRNEILAARARLFDQLEDAIDGAIDKESKLNEFAIQAARNLQDGFAEFFKGTSEGFRGILRDFGTLLRDMAAELLAQELLTLFFGKFKGTGGLLGGIADAVIGRRALGGPLSAMQPALVGESGPELFVPRVPGRIVPQGQFGQGVVIHSAPTINFQGDRQDIPTLLAMLEENNHNLEARILTRLRSRTT